MADVFGEQKYIWLAEVVQNWNEVSPGEKEQFLEYLLYCFMRTQELPVGTMYGPRSRIGSKCQDCHPPPILSPLESVTFSYSCDKLSGTSNLERVILTQS